MLGLTLAVFFYSGSFGIGGAVPENMAAHQFTIRDGKGTSRGTWGVADDGTVRFLLSDARGQPRVRLSLLGDGSSGSRSPTRPTGSSVVLGALPDQSRRS